MKATKLGFAALSLALVIGTAQAREEDDTAARLTSLQSQAGDPVASLKVNDNNASWEALGNRDLLIHSQNDNQTWLLHTSLCPGLTSVKRIWVTYANDARVYVGTDYVRRLDEAGGRCQILEARPIANVQVQGARGSLVTSPRDRNESDLPASKAP